MPVEVSTNLFGFLLEVDYFNVCFCHLL